ncbi:MAG TPA: VWD domain-containing protein [Gaiellaceae bacterium]|nr:VWD domain-containing protein [Gaiellaceae bacterium]
MTRAAGTLVVLCTVVVLGLSAAGSAQADPWVGKWKSVDVDGSNQTLTIARRAGAYDVLLFDDRASACGGIAANGVGVGTVAGNVMTGTTTITCADGRVLGTFPFKGTYNAQNDTFTDGFGVVWSRVKEPAPPKAKPLPLGRLVLTNREAPGLKQRAAKPAAAKKVLASALRPAKLPSFAPKQTQVSHFTRGKTELWSVAFVMKSAAAARAANSAITKAARRAKSTFVLWRNGHVVSAIVYRSRLRAARERAIAAAYADVARDRVARAVTKTAWQWALEQIGPRGKISRKAALDLFALAYAPLPGTARPAGPTGRIVDGTLAAQALLRHWKTLTPAQQQAALGLLGLAGVKQSARKAVNVARPASLGDPGFKVDTKLTELAGLYRDTYRTRIGYTLQSKIAAGRTTTPLTAWADATSVDDKGNQGGDFCRIRLGPTAPQEEGDHLSWLIAHEVFKCFQIELIPFTEAATRPWITEGTAMWASLTVKPLPWSPWSGILEISPYFTSCNAPLLGRADDAAFFFGHNTDTFGSSWKLVKYALQFANDDANVVALGGGTVPSFVSTWASSVVLQSGLPLSWFSSSPMKPPAGAGCPEIPVELDSTVEASPFSLFPYVIFLASPDELLLNVRVKPLHHARLSDGTVDTSNLANSWFCLQGECKCPPGQEGFPPPSTKLTLPAHLALAGGLQGSGAALRLFTLEEYCKETQEPPKTECELDHPVPRLVSSFQAAAGCPTKKHPVPIPPPGHPDPDEDPPDPLGCTGHGCGQSAADPHLLPFGGNWYDFQAAGEFTLVRSLPGDLEVQVRQEPYPGSDVVSINTAVAMRVGRNRVGIYRGWPLTVRVNGQPVQLGNKELKLAGGGIVRPLRQAQVEVAWPDGTVVRVIPPTDIAIDVIVNLGASRLGKVTGLLGDSDGSPADDFRTRSGRVLDPTVIRGKDRRTYRLLYRVYGDSWRLTPKTSLFDYAPGQSTRTFTNRRFPARIAVVEQLSPALRRKAEKVCRRMGFTSPRVLEACILDVAQTGHFGFSTALALSQLAAGKPKKKAAPPPPALKALTATLTFQGKTLTFRGAKNQTEGCRPFGEIRFRIVLGTLLTNDSRPVFIMTVNSGTKDGTYTSGVGGTFEAVVAGQKTLVSFETLTVTLAGNRTRGTFSGTASTILGREAVSGSFRC